MITFIPPSRGARSAEPAASSTDRSLRLAGRFDLQPRERRLLVDGQPLSLGARAFDLLCALTERPGRLVDKQALMDLVWPGLIVTENNIQQQVSTLRRLLGSDTIETVSGSGYRFVAEVEVEVRRPTPPSDAEPATLPPGGIPKTNLPRTLPPLIGRERDLDTLEALLDAHRLVTLTGAGGVGKSRLAQALLFARRDRHPQGVCLVDLSSTTEPRAVPGIIGTALGVAVAPGPDALQALVDALAPLALLLALDNAEHLVDSIAAVTEALHRAAPEVRLLVTSQVPLRISAEQVCHVGPLDLPATTPPAACATDYGALALFVERARAADHRFELTDDNVEAVVEVCRRLDGVALPIELAAARVPLLGLPRLAASLDQRLRLLTVGSLTAPPRQQTLRAALEWSHGLLGEAEQKVFRRLAVFIGSGSLEAVQRTCADDTLDEWDVLEALGALVDRSLVTMIDEGQPRYRLLDTPHSFALERLSVSGEEGEVRWRHLAAMRALFEPALDERYAGRIGIDDWSAALEPDGCNALAALHWAVAHDDASSALAIVPALHGLMSGSPRQHDAAAMWAAIEPILAAPEAEALPPALIGRALTAHAHFHAIAQPLRSQAIAARAVKAMRAGTDRIGLYVACDRLCWPAKRLGNAAQMQAALETMRELEDPAWAPAVKLYRAECEYFVLCDAGDFDGAERWARQQREYEQQAGWSQSVARNNAIHAAVTAGRAAEILDEARAVVTQLTGGRDRRTLAFARFDLVTALLATGAVDEADEVARQGWSEGALFGLRAWWADELALLAALRSRPHAAARLIGHADVLYQASGERRDALQTASVRRALERTTDRLQPTLLQSLRSEGSMLSDAAVAALAFGEDQGI